MLAGAIVYTTEKGPGTLWLFLRDARTEVRKVVWPTRTETLQTTGIVIVMVSHPRRHHVGASTASSRWRSSRLLGSD